MLISSMLSRLTLLVPLISKLCSLLIPLFKDTNHNIDSPYHFLKLSGGQVYCTYLGENDTNTFYCLRYYEIIPQSLCKKYFNPDTRPLTKLEFTKACSMKNAQSCELYHVPYTRGQASRGH